MKQKLIICLFIISSFLAKAQTSNVITALEFDSLKINNSTLSELKKTNGKQADVEALLGTATSYKADENESYYYYVFKGFKVDFSTAKDTPYIESFEISDNQATFTIKGKTIKVGDNISLLGTVVFSPGRDGSKSIIYTACEDCDSFVSLEFDQATNIITKINYLDMS